MSDELLAQKIKEVIKNDTGAWWETHGKIFGKDRSKGVFKPLRNCLQTRIGKVINRFEDLNLPARIIGLKPRQKGSTTYFCAEDYARLRRKPASGVIIGGEFSQTKEAWAMMQTYQKNDAFNWGNEGEINAKEGKWSNGSRLKPETAKDALAGISGTYQVLHCTEAARWSGFGVANASDVLANILKCVPTIPDTLITLESTAEGASGEFYERWLKAVDAEDFVNGTAECSPGSYVRVFSAWFEFDDSAMRLTNDQKKLVEKTLDAQEEFSGEKELIEQYGYTDEDGIKHLGRFVKDYDVWEQLAWRRYAIREECKRDKANFDRDFPHSWRTAFQKSGTMRFNQTGLSVLRKRLSQRVAEHGILEDTKERRLNWRRTEEAEAKFTIFEKPIVGCRYILSVDPMTGATQTVGLDPDKHGIFIIRAGYWANNGGWVRPATAARIIQCRWDIDVVEDAVWKLARFYGSRSGCKIAIEMNMDRGLTELLKLRGADLYVREVFNQLEQKTTGALGFQTNSKTREMLVEGLAAAIREWDTPGNGIDIFCPHALDQFDNFIVKPNGRSEAGEGCFLAGAQILTQLSCVPVEAIKAGMMVTTHKGRLRPVIKPMRRHYDGEVFNFRVSGLPWDVIATKEHPFLAKKRTCKFLQNRAKRKPFKTEWIQAKDLDRGDYLAIPKRTGLSKTEFTEDQLYVIGLWIAEGHILRSNDKQRIRGIGLTNTNLSFIEKFGSVLSNWFPDDKRMRACGSNQNEIIDTKCKWHVSKVYRRKKPIYKANFRSSYAGEFFNQFMDSQRKKVLGPLFDKSGILPAIAGMIDGDGTQRKKQAKDVTFYTSSSVLAKQTWQILIDHSIWSTMRMGTRKTPRHLLPWMLNIKSTFVKRLFPCTKTIGHIYLKNVQHVIEESDAFFTPIRGVEKRHFSGDVFNFSVKEDESYVASGVAVHNCHDDDIFGVGLGLELIGHATTYAPERFGDSMPPDLRERSSGRAASGAYS